MNTPTKPTPTLLEDVFGWLFTILFIAIHVIVAYPILRILFI